MEISRSNGFRTNNHLVRKRTLNHLAKLASLVKWLSFRLQTKWLRIRIPLLSLKLQICRLLGTRSSLTFRQTIECRFTLKLVRDMIITYSMEINEIFSFRYDFGKCKRDTCVNSSGMNAMFDIPYNFRLSVKFSTYMILVREKK